MFCESCGKEISESAAICIHCGAQVKGKLQPEYKPIVGFILSFFFNIIGFIVSLVEYRKAKEVGGVTTFALAGMIIGAVSFVLNLILLIVVVPIFLEMMEKALEEASKMSLMILCKIA